MKYIDFEYEMFAARPEWTLREPQSDNWEWKAETAAQIIVKSIL